MHQCLHSLEPFQDQLPAALLPMETTGQQNARVYDNVGIECGHVSFSLEGASVSCCWRGSWYVDVSVTANVAMSCSELDKHSSSRR